MTKALILIDFINEIVHENGKLASKGYSDFVKNNDVFQNLSFVTNKARENNILIIHFKLGFSNNYNEQPKSSPLFGKAHEYQALKLNSWATEFHKQIDVKDNDIILTKHRVSIFYSTPLDLILKNNNINSILIAGVSTDLAVSNAVRDAHDRDYQVTILEDCCAASNKEDHESALLSLKKIASVKNSKEVL
jgi:nicotinamidase-related amidase